MAGMDKLERLYLEEEYRSRWSGMIARCHDPKHADYRNYGARGIHVCPEWREGFWAFIGYVTEHLGPRPSPDHHLDRRNNDKGYEPGNIRWATPSENSLNKRSALMIPYKGEVLPLVEWCRRLGLSPVTVQKRIENWGWSGEQALETPTAESYAEWRESRLAKTVQRRTTRSAWRGGQSGP